MFNRLTRHFRRYKLGCIAEEKFFEIRHREHGRSVYIKFSELLDDIEKKAGKSIASTSPAKRLFAALRITGKI